MGSQSDVPRIESSLRGAMESLVSRTRPSTHPTVVIAWSGGADSTALLRASIAVRRRTFPTVQIAAVHVDHGLRDASDREARWCRARADELGIPIEVIQLEMAGSNNIEARARSRRYAAVRIAARRLEADAVWTAHHRDDVLETAVLNWIRGSGSDGLTSLLPGGNETAPIAAWRDTDTPIERPLASIKGEALREYLQARDVDWCVDKSNLEQLHRRNRLRREVMDSLRDIAGSSDPLMRTLENVRAEADVVANKADELLARAGRPTTDPESFAVDTANLGDSHVAVAARAIISIARRLPAPVGWNRDTLHDIHEAARNMGDVSGDPPHRFALRGAVATVARDVVTLAIERDRGTRALDARRARPIVISLDDLQDGPVVVPWFDRHFECRLVDRDDLNDPPTPPGTAWMSRDVLPDSVIMSGPKPGDPKSQSPEAAPRMRPIGSDSESTVSELLRAANTPPDRRWRHPCLFAAKDDSDQPDELLLVLGSRQAHHTRITESTNQALIVTSRSHTEGPG